MTRHNLATLFGLWGAIAAAVAASRPAEHSDLPYPSGSLTGGTPSSGVARRTGAPSGPFLATLASGAPSMPSVGSHPHRPR